MNKDIIISGYGGQGVLTLAEIISKSALKSNFNVKQTELHGLAQRGGALRAHVRISDKEISSPLISRSKADLIIGLDLLEAWRSGYWASKDKTIVLANSNIFWPYPDEIDQKKAQQEIENFSKELIVEDADKIVEKITGQKRSVNIYMLALAIKNKLLPFDKKVAWQAVEDKLKGKGLKENKEVFGKAF
jgi:indolepyruvate ferredoxin oxidoreductase beta subunit